MVAISRVSAARSSPEESSSAIFLYFSYGIGLLPLCAGVPSLVKAFLKKAKATQGRAWQLPLHLLSVKQSRFQFNDELPGCTLSQALS
jgi:hypothetical protein